MRPLQGQHYTYLDFSYSAHWLYKQMDLAIYTKQSIGFSHCSTDKLSTILLEFFQPKSVELGCSDQVNHNLNFSRFSRKQITFKLCMDSFKASKIFFRLQFFYKKCQLNKKHTAASSLHTGFIKLKHVLFLHTNHRRAIVSMPQTHLQAILIAAGSLAVQRVYYIHDCDKIIEKCDASCAINVNSEKTSSQYGLIKVTRDAD